MFSKSFEKYVNSLKQKKYRLEHGCFIAEGEKVAVEILHSELGIDKIIALPSWVASHEKLLKKQKASVTVVTEIEMNRVSALSQPAEVMLVVEIPKQETDEKTVTANLHLVLENIQDPGNMGTIIRIADWFGIPYIFCSEDCVDAYNPKVIQATMGSISRVKVVETNLAE
ncbi:MAG TPA: TrmH family RNA methyltransferase, partial [Puia sp.]|nr:TrmH family RNA methyltransferase [Puia sp.]